jgi:hypothetical protein
MPPTIPGTTNIAYTFARMEETTITLHYSQSAMLRDLMVPLDKRAFPLR